jgi:hypothetical protein
MSTRTHVFVLVAFSQPFRVEVDGETRTYVSGQTYVIREPLATQAIGVGVARAIEVRPSTDVDNDVTVDELNALASQSVSHDPQSIPEAVVGDESEEA